MSIGNHQLLKADSVQGFRKDRAFVLAVVQRNGAALAYASRTHSFVLFLGDGLCVNPNQCGAGTGNVSK